MLRSTLLAVSFLAAAPVHAQQGSAGPDFARLVPKGATILIQFESLEKLAKDADWVRATFEIDPDAITPSALFENMFDFAGVPAEHVDPSRPLGIAMVLNQNQVLAILPALDPVAMVGQLEHGPSRPAPLIAGSYVGVCGSGTGTYELSPGDSRLLAGPNGSLVWARVDLRAIIETFGPMIDMGLQQVEQMIDSGALQQADVPFDVSEFMQLYLDFLYDLKDSADLIEAAVFTRGELLELDGRLEVLPASPLAAWARSEKVDYQAWAAQLDPQAQVQMLSNYQASEMMSKLPGVYDQMFDQLAEKASGQDFPIEFFDAFKAYMTKSMELAQLMNGPQAVSFSLTGTGPRLSAVYQCTDPAALMSASMGLMRDPALAQVGVRFDTVEEQNTPQGRVMRSRIQFDIDKLMQLVPTAERPQEAELSKAREAVAKILGANGMETTWVVGADRIMVAAAPEASYAQAALARLHAGGSTPVPDLQRLAKRLEGANPASLALIDMGGLLGGVADLIQYIAPEAAQEPEFELMVGLGRQRLPMAMTWGVASTKWDLHLELPRRGLEELGKTVVQQKQTERTHAQCRSDMEAIQSAIHNFMESHQENAPASLADLLVKNADGVAFLDELPKDPWGREYLYEPQTEDQPARVRTLGRDGRPGGSGLDKDLSSDEY
jgi:hypothetical protein